MKVTLVNKSTLCDDSLRKIVDFLAPLYHDVGKPMHLTFKSKRGTGTWGRALYPVPLDRRCIKVGEFAATVYVGTESRAYPFDHTYKKHAGGMTFHDSVEEIVHTTAHELRHVEQYDECLRDQKIAWLPKFIFREWTRRNCRHRSCEIDAEMVANQVLDKYREHLDSRSLTPAPICGTLLP